ncbi:8-amino-7-oxononanoate synthase [Teredinibacter haidensis]|uniref:8-amino-7-oxononanoate synthase n=1 Tax=Teredinibacter haidensis TaxID=2731755 RepID=UPI0009490AE7|nr:8-amino-7-oxononanoate synthase [Teredinibacter haidensis]
MNFEQFLAQKLDERKAQHRYRTRKVVESPQDTVIREGGRELLNFCSNDYLGLASHPDVIAAMQQAAGNWGVGSGASHLVNGHSEEHHKLEEELAAFTGRERALLFSSGYMANLGVINALVGKGDLVLQDKINHASLIDGGLLSSADFSRYRHNDMEHLEKRLKASKHGRKLIVTDGVFSMDGDLAALPEMVKLAEKYGAWIMVDDAHGFGSLGTGGRGSVDLFGLNQQQVPVLIGTLGKAFGTFGAFIAGSEALVESLIQFSRTYIYTTALPPAVAAATRTSLKLLQAAEGRRQKLKQLIEMFQEGCANLGLELMPSSSPIQPVVVGSDKQALQMANDLAQKGCWVSAIRPPTVPEGTARLRVTFTAQHTPQQVEQLLDAFEYALGSANAS